MKHYVYDQSFEGLFTAVFDAYYTKEEPADISGGEFNLRLDADIYEVVTDPEKASRVMDAAEKKIGRGTVAHIYTAFMSETPGREMDIYRYLRMGFSVGRKLSLYLSADCVKSVNDMAQKTANEAHLLKGFLRFEEMENGVWYAEISPKTNCLEMLMHHFTLRFGALPFVINDTQRKLAAVYDTKRWEIKDYETLTLPRVTEKEREYRAMWKEFYKTLAIKERYNPRCRMTHMPKRFWKNMTEMKL